MSQLTTARGVAPFATLFRRLEAMPFVTSQCGTRSSQRKTEPNSVKAVVVLSVTEDRAVLLDRIFTF